MCSCISPRLALPPTGGAGLCRRRRWPEPSYEAYNTPAGYTCVVRVNNREYQTDAVYGSETLARESAAMRAYLICRNFSVNDGMYPVGHDHGGVVQGIPVAIGTGRKSSRDDSDTSTEGNGVETENLWRWWLKMVGEAILALNVMMDSALVL
ncbi:hypothetical protein N7532_008932 [Penicillium argentinense]|uniref:DRBM domain-containing protein n=1 Tax=Penicillium argentinense TaxID=1131581 RepID=A0A9W9EYB6_9EURO|nr:uncharacterized protein N7532_008932 [Penicillium argentinense]KAJ5090248.1 hypothetical protein N7532_008932 [Penicillium argentinense]